MPRRADPEPTATNLRTPLLAVAWPTVRQARLAEFLTTAAAAGFDAVHLKPHDLLHNDVGDVRAVVRRCAELGLVVEGVDPLLGPWPDPPDARAADPLLAQLLAIGPEQCVELAAEVGARFVNVAQIGCGPTPLAALGDAFGRMCVVAAGHGIELALEFLPGASDVGSPADALEVLRLAGAPANGRIQVDTWHVHRGGFGAAELRALPPGTVGAVQINDARREDHDDPRAPSPDRLLPGEGVVPLAALLAPLLRDHGCPSVAVEVFSRLEAARPAAAVMQAAARGARHVLDEAVARAVPERTEQRRRQLRA